MKFNIVLLCPAGYVHAMAFWEVGLLLEAALEDLGHEVRVQENRFEGGEFLNVVLGYHLLADPGLLAGVRYVVYQLEQFSPESGWITPRQIEMLRGAEAVWEYSRANMAIWAGQGVERVKYLPLGYHRKLELIRPVPEPGKTIDVLFYGSVNERRRRVLTALRRHCRVEELMGIYGGERDAAIARARLVLHVHFFQAKLAAQVRVSYLLNNGVPVVSEASAEEPFAGMIEAVPYEELVGTCLRLVGDAGEREALGRKGHALFQSRPMVAELQRVLG